MNEPFLSAVPLLTKIEDEGFEAYFVGGSVRDLLLGRDIADIDIATSATPQEIQAIFPKTIDVGVEHGTIVVLFSGKTYEVTTFRTEAEYEDCRRPSEVQFIRSLEEDLKRRDFTMNAIAMDKRGQFIDPFHGKRAIENRVIQTVGKAEERFSEDALRMMRAVRFFSQLNFQIETTTRAALIQYAHLLKHISTERKLIEFEKLLVGKNRKHALEMLHETRLYMYLPGMAPYSEGLTRMCKYDTTSLTIEEMWAFLIYQLRINNDEINSFLKTWKLPVKKIKKIIHLVKWLMIRLKIDWTDEALYKAGMNTIFSTERIYNLLHNQEIDSRIDRLLEQYETLPIKQRSELNVTGNDLLDWFQKKQGPWIREKIEMVEKAVIHRKVSNHNQSIREWLIECNQN
ncbi:CCA tRNA nucleotidyltransferase [Cytobacillus solani]|uniref:CCA-adding enzyme n=1 Tax=Cytobacillus solani TaxID=1637975 RepID=A0A0Q3SKR0_9BACI|nr:CCA tRNA nucleotidyltransferase [Cytobacillus solani]KQL20244.1 tRNA nucleotidyltransferase [Cytobacillus solani]USK53499.1 CCA tRNA nucleotidyltransferase [Cytobacillus solani]